MSKSSGSGSQPKQYSDQDLLDEIRRLREELGHVPKYRDMDSEGKFAPVTYNRRFGGWNEALQAAGFPTRDEIGLDMPNRVSDAQLLDEIERLHDELGQVPTKDDMNEFGKHSSSTYIDRFGGFREGVREAGFSPQPRHSRPKYSREELIEELHRLADVVDRVPSMKEMRERGRYSDSVYEYRFGTWGRALEAAEFEDPGQGYRSGDQHPNWKGGIAVRYTEYWRQQRQKARERDGFCCRTCGETDEHHKSRLGRELSVHHIRPVRGFEVTEEAHRLSNLVTLCQECHNRWEGVPVFPSVNEE